MTRSFPSALRTYCWVDPAAEGVGVADVPLGLVCSTCFLALWAALAGLGVLAFATFGLGVATLAALGVFFAVVGAGVVEGTCPGVGDSAARAKPTLKHTALSAEIPTKRRMPITSSCN